MARRSERWQEWGAGTIRPNGIDIVATSSALTSDHPRPVLAAACLCAGIMIFSAQDWIIKLLSGDYPVHQALALRGIVAVPILGIVVALTSGYRALLSPRAGWLSLRGLTLMVCYTTYYLAFPSMPLANVVALYFTVPLFVTALAVLFLGEKVGVRRWTATAVGFIGILIIVRPLTDQFDLASLLPIASALTYTIAALMTRRMGVSESAPVMSFYQNLMYLFTALVLAAIFGGGAFAGSGNPSVEFLVRGWVTPSPRDFALLAACGVIAALGATLLTQAYRLAEANFVAGFEYSAIIWATLGGYWFWREVPDAYAWIGMALIVAAGIYTLFRERRVAPQLEEGKLPMR